MCGWHRVSEEGDSTSCGKQATVRVKLYEADGTTQVISACREHSSTLGGMYPDNIEVVGSFL